MRAERYARIRRVLDRRQPDLTVLMERVHKPHNFSAILRNCDAVGILEAHAIAAEDDLPVHRGTSAGTSKWVDVKLHDGLDEALVGLRAEDFRVLAAHPSPGARDYRDSELTAPTCIMVGAELHGLSSAAVERADELVSIPMVGMVRSLNVSVATSLLLFEAFRQREAAGMYDAPRLDPDRYRRLAFEWTYPDLAERYRRRDESYPPLDEEGEIVRPDPRSGPGRLPG